jgi:Zn-dependent protease
LDIEVNEKLIKLILFLPGFLVSLAVHEFSHAWFANKFGDTTAKDQGRLTLNPIKHLELVGSVIVPLLTFISGAFIIGWAKPVPVNMRNFKNPYREDAIVSIAGPLSNLLLSLVFLIVYLVLREINLANNLIMDTIWLAIMFNVFLCLFNLLPIPPLDGSHILFDMFPNKYTAKYLNLGIYGSILIIVFIYSPLWDVFWSAVSSVIDFYRMF